MTATTQQYACMLEEGRTNPENVRKHFVNDLYAFLSQYKALGDKIILGGDFNTTLGAETGGITRLCKNLDLIDPIHHRHGYPSQSFPTWVRGKDTIDCILVDSSLLPAVQACGYEKFYYRIHGDHQGMFIDFDTRDLFGKENTKLATFAKRKLNSQVHAQVTKYFRSQHA